MGPKVVQKGVKIPHFWTKKTVILRVKNTDFWSKNGVILGLKKGHFWVKKRDQKWPKFDPHFWEGPESPIGQVNHQNGPFWVKNGSKMGPKMGPKMTPFLAKMAKNGVKNKVVLAQNRLYGTMSWPEPAQKGVKIAHFGGFQTPTWGTPQIPL